jgi:hypothetical protein
MHSKNFVVPTVLALFLLNACKPQAGHSDSTSAPPVNMVRTGWLASDQIMEASGIQASHAREGDFFVHEDSGEPVLYAIDETGADLGTIAIVPAKNRDWEDITSVPVAGERWLVIGDIGDNMAKRESIRLYFVEEPRTGKFNRYSGEQILKHALSLTYPDGPRDCESLAYDPVTEQILLLSKRDNPPRLYAVALATALSGDQTELKFLGSMAKLRPPASRDRFQFGGRTDFISQPTGIDISADGTEMVIITYRSLYRYRRDPGEDWLSALQKSPQEVVGPPAVQNEAVSYSIDGRAIYVTSENLPAPVYRVEFTSDQ